MPDLEDVVSNPEVVTSALGRWPSFHDAEVMSIELRRDGRPWVPTAKSEMKTMGFPGGPSGKSLVALLFTDVDSVELYNFNAQNVLYDLTVETTSDGRKLSINGTYGLEGGFSFAEAEVLSAERPTDAP